MPLPKMPDPQIPSGEPSFASANPFDGVRASSESMKGSLPVTPKSDDLDLGFDLDLDDSSSEGSSNHHQSDSLDDDIFGISGDAAPVTPANSTGFDFGDDMESGFDLDLDIDDDHDHDHANTSFSGGFEYGGTKTEIAASLIENALENPEVTEISIDSPTEMFVRIKGKNIKVEEFDLGRNIEDYHSVLNDTLVSRVHGEVRPIANDYLIEMQIPIHYEGIGESSARCHILTPPITPAAVVTIAKRPSKPITIYDMVNGGTMTREMAQFLIDLVKAHKNIIISGGTGAGKMQRLSTPIPTPSGWTTVGDIQPGDKIFDHHGNVGKVLEKFPHKEKSVYKVTFSTGEEEFVGDEHNFYVSTHASRKANLYRENSDPRRRQPNVDDEHIEILARSLVSSSEDDMIGIAGLSKIVGRSICGTLQNRLLEVASTEETAAVGRKFLVNKKLAIRWLLTNYAGGFVNDQRDKRVPLYSTKNTLKLLEEGVIDERGRYNFHVPVLESPVEFDRSIQNGTGFDVSDLPIHPYAFGLWLGDGSSRDKRLTASPEDAKSYQLIFESLNSDVTVAPYPRNKDEKGNDWKFDGNFSAKALRELGVLQKTSSEGSKKDVPGIYEFASVEARRLLLAGLFDSDGCVERGYWVFTNTNRNLVDAVYRIANSLGYRSSISKGKPCKYTVDGKKKSTENESWDVVVSTTDNIGLLPRKVNAQDEYNEAHGTVMRRDKTRVIRSIEMLDEKEDMACLAVDTVDHTYLSGHGYLVDHNTTLLSALGNAGFSDDEKLIVIEDLPELDFNKKFSLYLHTTPEKPGVDPNRVTMDYLVRQTKRMRTSRVVIGEVRGPEITSFLDVASSGVSGSMNTLHSESAKDALATIENLAMSGGETSDGAIASIKKSIVKSIDIVVQAHREEGKEHNRHLVTEIVEVGKSLQGNNFGTTPIFKWDERTESFMAVDRPSDALLDELVAKKMESAALWGRTV